MASTFRYLSSTDGYLPMPTQYLIGYVRQKDQFPLNKYVQLVEAPAPSFTYIKLERDQSVRVRGLGLHVWSDGAERPVRTDNQFAFLHTQAFCIRYDFNSRVGNIALQMAAKQWDAKQVYLQGLASQAMTARTLNIWQGIGGGTTANTGGWAGLDNAATWPSTNVASANSLNGGAGTWDKAGSDTGNPANYMAIRKSIMRAVNAIFLNTNGRVTYKDLKLVVSPNLAYAMANSDEIRDAYKYGPNSREMIEGKDNYSERFGLPPVYAGVEIVIEDSPILQDLPTDGQTTESTARAFVKNDTNAVLLSRPGKVDSQIGPSFSTVQLYWFEHQMKVQEFVDPKHEFTDMHVSDYYTVVGPALEAGYLITGCL